MINTIVQFYYQCVIINKRIINLCGNFIYNKSKSEFIYGFEILWFGYY